MKFNKNSIHLTDYEIRISKPEDYNIIYNALSSCGEYVKELSRNSKKTGFISSSYSTIRTYERNPFGTFRPDYYHIWDISKSSGSNQTISVKMFLILVNNKLEYNRKLKIIQNNKKIFNQLSLEEKIQYFKDLNIDIDLINDLIIKNIVDIYDTVIFFESVDYIHRLYSNINGFNKMLNLISKIVPYDFKTEKILGEGEELEYRMNIVRYFLFICNNVQKIRSNRISCNSRIDDTILMIDNFPDLLNSPKECSILLVLKSEYDSIIDEFKKYIPNVTLDEIMKNIEISNNINYKNTIKGYKLLLETGIY